MSLNKVFLIGRLGQDPIARYMPNGEAVCNFSIATSETWKDQHGQKQERTEWHNITLYRRMAEVAGQYLKKGSQVYIEGRIQSRKYTGKDGIERTAYDIIGSEMKMLGGRQSSGSSAPYDEGYQPAPQQQYQQQSYQAQQQPAYNGEPLAAPSRQAPAAPAQPVDDIDDDVPF